jgi:hypothetical protein
VTAADITTALGTAPVSPPSTATLDQCDFSSPGAPNYVNISTSTMVLPRFFQQDARGGGGTQTVSGLGDAAYETPVGAQAGSIFVLQGKHQLRIDIYAPVTTATQAALRQLTQTALARVG